jgi:bifunctional UDP-N-acetylglucosamine pyrophosphorylase/glucosamine-1-phosphate N-acetyltransferase
MFIAPVTVGDGAYTAAGTVVRKNVPAGSLAMTVAPQRNVQDWVVRRRPGTAAANAAERAQHASYPHEGDEPTGEESGR